jgi:hypothetical protein
MCCTLPAWLSISTPLQSEPGVFEHRSEPVLPRGLFLQRLGRSGLLALAIALGSLALGAAGYRICEHMEWIDAVLNAAMLLSGEGPVSVLRTYQGKIFASLFSLYSGLVVLVVTGVMLAPAAHRLLHLFHHDRTQRPE